jgi:hypothetical protein
MTDPEGHSFATILCAGTVAAFAAVTPAALMFGLISMNGGLLLFAYVVGVPIAIVHSWLLGIPAYLFLRERWALSWEAAALGGFVVGLLPATVLSLVLDVGGIDFSVVIAGMLGACGGLGFKAFLRSFE